MGLITQALHELFELVQERPSHLVFAEAVGDHADHLTFGHARKINNEVEASGYPPHFGRRQLF